MYLAHPRSKSRRKKLYQIEAMIMGFKMEGVDRVTVTFLKTFWCTLGRENVKNNIFHLLPWPCMMSFALLHAYCTFA